MRGKLLTALSILTAGVGWWGLYELTARVAPDAAGALPFFFALLFAAVTGTVAPAAAYLNRRFAPLATARDPWRFLRHSAWAGICVSIWAWLQMNRAFNAAFAIITILIFIALEVLIVRLREESTQGG